jgi:hypothetical protein
MTTAEKVLDGSPQSVLNAAIFYPFWVRVGGEGCWIVGLGGLSPEQRGAINNLDNSETW